MNRPLAITQPHVTPAALASDLGISERTLRARARALGACRIFGKTMVLLPEDVAVLLEYARTPRPLLLRIIEEQAARIAELEARDQQRFRVASDAQSGAGFVYIVEGEKNYVKIGFAKNVAKRVKALQTSFPFRLTVLAEIPGTKEDEAALHQRFREVRIGGEWFYLSPELKSFIAGLNK